MREGVLNSRGVRRRAEIVAAARSAFAEAGYRGTTMAAVATRASVTHAGLLYHFATKEDLLEAVLADEGDRQVELLGAVDTTDGSDALDRLRALAMRNDAEPEWARLFSMLLGEAVSPDHPVRARMAERYDTVAAGLASSLEARAGASRAPSAAERESLARLLLAVMDGLQYQSLTGSGVDVGREFALMADLVRARLRSDPPPFT